MNGICKIGKEQAIERGKGYFNKDYNCCETILLTCSELLGIKSEIIPKLATPFGGGIYKRKYMCGALSGAIMAVGLKYGRSTPKGDREISYSKAERLVDKFIKKYEYVNCIDILGYDPGDLESIKRDKQRIRTDICEPIIKQVTEWLWEELQ